VAEDCPAIHAKSAALGAANSAAFAAEPGEEKQAIEKYRRWFEEMVEEEFSRAGLTDAIPGLLSGESNGAGDSNPNRDAAVKTQCAA